MHKKIIKLRSRKMKKNQNLRKRKMFLGWWMMVNVKSTNELETNL